MVSNCKCDHPYSFVIPTQRMALSHESAQWRKITGLDYWRLASERADELDFTMTVARFQRTECKV